MWIVRLDGSGAAFMVFLSTFVASLYLLYFLLRFDHWAHLLAVVAVFVAAGGVGKIVGVAVGRVTDRVCRELWPERTDDHER
jgi:lipoprotein signal peptidase